VTIFYAIWIFYYLITFFSFYGGNYDSTIWLVGVKKYAILHENRAYVCVGNDYQWVRVIILYVSLSFTKFFLCALKYQCWSLIFWQTYYVPDDFIKFSD
jgi:hypothetical protein